MGHFEDQQISQAKDLAASVPALSDDRAAINRLSAALVTLAGQLADLQKRVTDIE